jgi:glyoxylase-like metal-dependent hydrolase (beta-lactamase superfamily II)
MARDGKTADSIQLIICTHGHPDHIEAIDSFDNNVLRAISKDEYSYLSKEGKDLFLMSGCPAPKKPFSLFLKNGLMTIGDNTFQVIQTPGHSPGSICLYWEEEKLLISGDTLFYMGFGRTDLPGGDQDALVNSIQRIAGLDIEYLIPGHGEMLKGAQSIRRNFELILGEFF